MCNGDGSATTNTGISAYLTRCSRIAGSYEGIETQVFLCYHGDPKPVHLLVTDAYASIYKHY